MFFFPALLLLVIVVTASFQIGLSNMLPSLGHHCHLKLSTAAPSNETAISMQMPCAALAGLLDREKLPQYWQSFLILFYETSSHITKALVRHARRPKSESALCFPFCVLFASRSETSCGELIKADHQLNRIIVAWQEPFPAGEVRKQRGARIIAEGRTCRGRSPGEGLAEEHFHVRFFLRLGCSNPKANCWEGWGCSVMRHGPRELHLQQCASHEQH